MKQRMWLTRIRLQILVLWGVAMVVLSACAPQEPVLIYITPTPNISDSVSVAISETDVATPQQPQTIEAQTAEQTSEVTVTQTTIAENTPTPQSTSESMPVDSTATQIVPTVDDSQPTATLVPGEFFGAIIGPDYTLPPTSTPRPTTIPTIEALPSSTANMVPTAIPQQISSSLNGAHIGVQIYYNVDIDTFHTLLLQAQKLNVTWVKLQANWAFMQPSSPDEYEQNFRLFEAHVQRAKGMGFNVMLSVAKAPNWARSIQEDDGPPDDPQLLANFLNFMITRIKPEHIDAIEIWNEPNLIREWRGTLPFSGAGYMQLFRPAHQAIKAIDPTIMVISAGLAPTGDSAGSLDDRTFLQQMYGAGLSEYPDIAIGVHPYGWGNAPDATCCNAIENRGWDDDPHFFFKDTLDAYSEIMQNAGHGVQMWATELGWATWEGFPTEPPEPWMTYTSAQQQAQYLLRALEIGQNRDDVGVNIIWNLNFGSEQTILDRVEMAGYSLMISLPEVGLQFRPAFDALASATQR
jgi:hypothetical protein